MQTHVENVLKKKKKRIWNVHQNKKGENLQRYIFNTFLVLPINILFIMKMDIRLNELWNPFEER